MKRTSKSSQNPLSQRRRATSPQATLKRSPTLRALDAARSAFLRGEGKSEKNLDQAVTVAIDKAEALQNDPKAWCTFVAAPFFDERKIKPTSVSDALRFVLIYLLVERKRASRVFRAIEPFYNQVDLTASQIIEKVKALNGYEKAAASHRRKGRAKTPESRMILEFVRQSDRDYYQAIRASQTLTLVVRVGKRNKAHLRAHVIELFIHDD